MKTYNELIKGITSIEKQNEIYSVFEKQIIKGAKVFNLKTRKSGDVVSVVDGVANVRDRKGKYFKSIIGNLTLVSNS